MLSRRSSAASCPDGYGLPYLVLDNNNISTDAGDVFQRFSALALPTGLYTTCVVVYKVLGRRFHRLRRLMHCAAAPAPTAVPAACRVHITYTHGNPEPLSDRACYLLSAESVSSSGVAEGERSRHRIHESMRADENTCEKESNGR